MDQIEKESTKYMVFWKFIGNVVIIKSKKYTYISVRQTKETNFLKVNKKIITLLIELVSSAQHLNDTA